MGASVGRLVDCWTPPLAGFVAKEFLGDLVPPVYGWALTLLGVGTAASFSKTLPLMRPAARHGQWGGIILLGIGVVGFSAWGLASLPGLRAAATWGKALAAVGAGYVLSFLFRRTQVRLPEVQLDHMSVAMLIAAALLAVFYLLP